MRIYISGPITGNEKAAAQFAEAAEKITKAGSEYINPANLQQAFPGGKWAEYMLLDLQLLEWADAIAFLPGAERSVGSLIEYEAAKDLGLLEYDLEKNTFRTMA